MSENATYEYPIPSSKSVTINTPAAAAHTNDTYITDDGTGPELWRRTEGNKQDQLLLTWGDLRAAMYHHKTGGPEYIKDVDRLWDAIAATAGEAPGDDQ